MLDLPNQCFAPAQQEGLRILRLRPLSKFCDGPTWESSVLATPEEIGIALAQGFNIGFLLTGKGGLHPNPLGIWGLDIDSKAAFDRYDDAPFDLMITRGHEFKRHYLARLPDPTKTRQSRLVRNSHDVKLTGILVAPGSKHVDGGVYTVYVRDRQTRAWVPWDGTAIDWANLSIVDPSPYIPSASKLIPLSADQARRAVLSTAKEWVFQEGSVSMNWCEQKFTQARGDLRTRQIRADYFIRSRIKHGIVSRAGDGGRATLLTTVIHLMRYLRLPEEMVREKLMNPVHNMELSWNDCCVDGETGAPYPWTLSEVESAIDAARHYVPHFGVIEHQRFQLREQVKERLWHFWGLLGHLAPPTERSPSMSAQQLYTAFLDLYSVSEEECSYRRFTLAFQAAMRSGVVKLANTRGSGRKKLRHYLGVNQALIEFALELASSEDPKAA